MGVANDYVADGTLDKTDIADAVVRLDSNNTNANKTAKKKKSRNNRLRLAALLGIGVLGTLAYSSATSLFNREQSFDPGTVTYNGEVFPCTQSILQDKLPPKVGEERYLVRLNGGATFTDYGLSGDPDVKQFPAGTNIYSLLCSSGTLGLDLLVTDKDITPVTQVQSPGTLQPNPLLYRRPVARSLDANVGNVLGDLLRD